MLGDGVDSLLGDDRVRVAPHRLDVNPLTGEPIGRHTHTVVAEQAVHSDAEHPSHVVLPVIPR